MDVVVQIALNAVIAGAVYALITIGFNLTYSTAKFFDLSYGALAVVGGYATLFVSRTLGYHTAFAIFCGILLAGVLGFAIEKIVYQPLRRRKATPTVLLIASLGVLTVLQALVALFFTSQFQILADFAGSDSVYTVLGGAITKVQVVILVSALMIMLGVGVLLRYTVFGKAVRAISDDEEVAQIVGINSEWVIAIVFFLGGAIAGVAGIAIGFDTGLVPTLALALLLKGVISMIIGGTGNVYGGVVGAFLLALIENLGAWQFSGEWKDAIAFAVLIVFLLVRPQGLFAK